MVEQKYKVPRYVRYVILDLLFIIVLGPFLQIVNSW